MENQKDEDRVLDTDFNNIELPTNLEERVLNRLKSQKLIVDSRSWFWQGGLKVAASIVFAIGVFAGGYFTGKYMLPSRQLASTPAQQYMLLLYNPSPFVPGSQHASEYGAWMRSVNNGEVSASGEELKNYGWTIEKKNNVVNMDGRPVSGPFGSLSGFFLLNVSSPERALEIAASCPHVKYNGVVELRPIQSH